MAGIAPVNMEMGRTAKYQAGPYARGGLPSATITGQRG
jgi:hypothetical protein